MGRDIKRVALDFNWPLGVTWEGYLMGEEFALPTCPDCEGRGITADAQWLGTISYIIGMLLDEALTGDQPRQPGRTYSRRGMHPWMDDIPPNGADIARPGGDLLEWASGMIEQYVPKYRYPEKHASLNDSEYVKSETERTLKELTEPKRRSAFGRSLNGTIEKALIVASGVDTATWGSCPMCDGEGDIATPEQRERHEAWESTEPPVGEGWQVWETVGEGSPITPVFPTAEALIDHLATVGYSGGWNRGPLSREGATALVNGGGAPSMMVTMVAGERQVITPETMNLLDGKKEG